MINRSNICAFAKAGLSMLVMAMVISLSSCDGFFGKKTDLGFIEPPDSAVRKVAYVPVLPEIKGGARAFQEIVHITTGFDRFFYVVDSAQGIFALDETGSPAGFFANPIGVNFSFCIQDRNLDLLAVGKKNVVVNNKTLRLSVIYRISLRDSSNGNVSISLNNAKIKHEMIYPYFLGDNQRLNDEQQVQRVNINQIGIISGNRYYVTCSSVDETPGGANFENNTVLICNLPDKEIGVEAWNQLQISGSDGQSFTYFRQPTAITTYVQPPQNYKLPDGNAEDFLVTLNDPKLSLPNRVTAISVSPASDGPPVYAFKSFPQPSESNAGFIYTPFRFKNPKAVTWVGDGRRQILVLDRDSVFLFSNQGVEGARPARGSTSTALVNVSFGGRGSSITQFNDARSIAYNNYTVFVVDKGNKRILRFKLTTDFD